MRDISQEHLVILRSYGDILDLKKYNCQELGLAKALVKKGLKVSLLMPDKNESTETLSTSFGDIHIVHIKIKWKLHARYCWFTNFEKKISSLKPTMIQVHDMDLLMTWRAVRWAKKKNIPCYLIQGPYDKWSKFGFRQLNELYNRTFGKYILKNVTGIGVKTMLASKYLNRYYPCKTRLTLIGLDVDAFANADNINWRAQIGIDKTKKVLLYIGSLQPRRNPLFLVELIKHLPNEYVMLIVGSGIQEEETKTKIKKEQLEERCIMLGRLSQKKLPSLYKNSDCFLLVSDYEILGMVIMEAMYFETPVISTKTTGSDFIIENGKNGIIIPNKEMSKWVEIVQTLFKDKGKLDKMAVAGKETVMNKFLWEKTCEGFLNLYFANKK